MTARRYFLLAYLARRVSDHVSIGRLHSPLIPFRRFGS